MDTRKKIIIASLIVILIIITVGIFLALKKNQQQSNNSTDSNGFPGTDRPSPVPKPISDNTLSGTDTGSSPSSSTSSGSGTSTPVSSNSGKGGSASGQTSTIPSESPEGAGLGITIPTGQTNTTTGQSLGNGSNSGLNTTTSGGATSTTPGAITPSADPIENITPPVEPLLNPNDAALVLKPLPADNPKTTTINERDVEMKKRIFDIVWRKWDQDPQKVLSDKDRQRLYGEFSSIKQNITDAKSLVNSKNLLESIKLQNVDLANGYHDCMIIRDAAVKKNPGTGKPYLSTDETFWGAIRSQMLTPSLKIALNPEISIIGTSEKHPPSNDPINDPFWKNFNELMDADDLPGRGYDDTQEDRKPQVYQAMNGCRARY